MELNNYTFKRGELKDVLNLIKSNKNYSYCITFEAIKNGIENDLINAPLFKINLGEKTYDILLHRSKWQDHLERCMIYFEKTELYEKCAELKKLL
jgi:hypothetical protein